MHWLYHTVRHALVQWGYWAVLAGLLGENAGLPLPGETVLMSASFLCHQPTGLRLEWVIAVGVGAAVLGDNLGFLLGRKVGPRIIPWTMKIFHLDEEDLAIAEDQVERHGAGTVFWARFIFGLRTVAGPLAGMLGMEWKRFLLYNALGAIVWVSTMSMAGYAFGNAFNTLLQYFEKASWGLIIIAFGAGYYVWRRKKKRFEKAKAEHDSQEGSQA